MTPNQPLRLLSPFSPLRPHEHDALVDDARLRAVQLREQAQQEFFAAMFRALRRLWNSLRRSPHHARC